MVVRGKTSRADKSWTHLVMFGKGKVHMEKKMLRLMVVYLCKSCRVQNMFTEKQKISHITLNKS